MVGEDIEKDPLYKVVKNPIKIKDFKNKRGVTILGDSLFLNWDYPIISKYTSMKVLMLQNGGVMPDINIGINCQTEIDYNDECVEHHCNRCGKNFYMSMRELLSCYYRNEKICPHCRDISDEDLRMTLYKEKHPMPKEMEDEIKARSKARKEAEALRVKDTENKRSWLIKHFNDFSQQEIQKIYSETKSPTVKAASADEIDIAFARATEVLFESKKMRIG